MNAMRSGDAHAPRPCGCGREAMLQLHSAASAPQRVGGGGAMSAPSSTAIFIHDHLIRSLDCNRDDCNRPGWSRRSPGGWGCGPVGLPVRLQGHSGA